MIEQLLTLPSVPHVNMKHVAPLLGPPAGPKLEAGLSEKQWIIEGLRRNNLHRGKTAKYLGISRKTLYNKIHKLRILE